MHDATELASLVRSGQVTPLELVNAAIDRIERLNLQLNAVVWQRFEKARAEARSSALPQGPFCGVPFLTKDLGCSTAGEPDSAGSRFLKANGFTPAATTELARRIHAAGFINLGRTNTPEFGAVATTEPLAWGPTRNPWDLSRTASGSSGGSAAAVASGMVPVAHGSDGGGSIRLPAAACGLVGLKPTRGRVNMYPASEWVSPLSVQGFLTHSVRDTAACLDLASGNLPGDATPPPPPARPYAEECALPPGALKVGVWNELPIGIDGSLDPDCARAVSATASLLESLGHHVELAHPPVLDKPQSTALFSRIWPVRLLAALQAVERALNKTATADDLDPATLYWIHRARPVTAAEYLVALSDMDAFTRAFADWFTRYDILLLPTTGAVTPHLGELTMDGPNRALSFRFSPFTAYFNLSGQPAISLPLHTTSEGLPVGIQLGAAHAREDLLIRLSAQLEQAAPWSKRTPPVYANQGF